MSIVEQIKTEILEALRRNDLHTVARMREALRVLLCASFPNHAWVLLDRAPGETPMATTVVVAEDMIKRGKATGYTAISLSAIKLQRIKVYTEHDYFQHLNRASVL